MTYAAAGAERYRETQVLTASPSQLVVILFDHLLVNLHRAGGAIRSGDVGLRITLLDKSRAVLGELLATLNRERGGELADNLAALYAFVLGELLEIGRTPDSGRLERITSMMTEVRDAFAVLAGEDVD